MKNYISRLHHGAKAQGLIPVHLYLMLFAVAIVETVWIQFSRVTFITGDLTQTYLVIGLLVAGLVICIPQVQKQGASRVWRFLRFCLEALLILKLGGIIMRLFNHLTMTTAMPFQDKMLIAWDSYIGSPWLPYFNFMHDHPQMLKVLMFGYTSLTPLSAFMLFFLIVIGEYDRSKFFTVTFFYTAIVAMALGAFFPAMAAVATIIKDIKEYTNFSFSPGTYHIVPLDNLRAQTGEIQILLNRMPGLVTFPSFHTAAGIILMASFWRTPVFAVVFLYSVLMIASTPVFGGHYIIDLLGGTILAIVVIGFTRHILPAKTPSKTPDQS